LTTKLPIYYLGITFPFPVEKTALNTGKLLRWTKEISSNVSTGGVVDQDVVKLLQDAIDSKLRQKNLTSQIRCVALINDVSSRTNYR
jgi:hexokinase